MSSWIEKTENKKTPTRRNSPSGHSSPQWKKKSQTSWCLLLVMDPGIKMPEHYISVRKMVTLLLSSSEYKKQLSECMWTQIYHAKMPLSRTYVCFCWICPINLSKPFLAHQNETSKFHYSGKHYYVGLKKRKGYRITFNS